MSRQIDITVQGVVGTTPIVATTPSRRVYCRFRVASTPGYRDASGRWHNEETLWFTAKAWGALAENLARSLRKGDPVLLHGRLTQETWTPANGPEQTSNVITITSGGHDLARGTTSYMRVEPVMAAAHSAGTPQSAPSAASPEPSGTGTVAAQTPGEGALDAGTGAVKLSGAHEVSADGASTASGEDPWATPLPPLEDEAFSDAELSYETVDA